MNYTFLFQAANLAALASWLFLLVFPFSPLVRKLLSGVAVSLLAALYAVLLFGSLQPGDFAGFTSLEGIISLLSVPGAALTGWVHYLAFDLFTGIYIARNAGQNGIGHLPLLPCLLCTFMAGPVGLLLYFIVRWSFTRQWFVAS